MIRSKISLFVNNENSPRVVLLLLFLNFVLFFDTKILYGLGSIIGLELDFH